MSDSYLPDNEQRDILLSLEELASKKLPHAPTFRKAADEITRLRAENEKLRDALKPFVNMIDEKFQIYEYNDICMSLVNYDVLMRICNNAKDALEGVTEPPR